MIFAEPEHAHLKKIILRSAREAGEWLKRVRATSGIAKAKASLCVRGGFCPAKGEEERERVVLACHWLMSNSCGEYAGPFYVGCPEFYVNSLFL